VFLREKYTLKLLHFYYTYDKITKVIDIKLRREIMANIKSQKKRILISAKENARNTSKRSAIKTAVKKYESAIEAKDIEKATALLPALESTIDAAKSDGILHINAAARKKARFAKMLNSIKE
jgi:small subunit ribosomal protein S20